MFLCFFIVAIFARANIMEMYAHTMHLMHMNDFQKGTRNETNDIKAIRKANSPAITITTNSKLS